MGSAQDANKGATAFFRPHPLRWTGEGFQGFAVRRG